MVQKKKKRKSGLTATYTVPDGTGVGREERDPGVGREVSGAIRKTKKEEEKEETRRNKKKKEKKE